MIPKIAGFVLTSKPDHQVSLNFPLLVPTTLLGKWGKLTLYATGEGAEPVSPGVYSLGFPPHSGLLDHNLLITVGHEEVIIENDWLGGIPLYYNLTNRMVSSFPDVCLDGTPQWDQEGLYLFLKYGFSALGTTPFKNVSTLRYFSKLRFGPQGIVVKEKDDPALNADLSIPADENKIWAALNNKVNGAMKQTSGPVILPLSGGLDSRIIATMAGSEYKERMRAFSYGSSPRQERSFESRIASLAADKLKIKWQHVHLNNAYKHVDEWHSMFGFASHLHGMYHIEFYRKILSELQPGRPAFMFSGISGSPFQGEFPARAHVQRPSQLYSLALTHGIDCRALLPIRETEAEARFFEQNRALLQELRWYPVIMVRMKMNMLHYLHKVPAMLGIASMPVFHNFRTVVQMLSLPAERRNNRQWVNDYFEERGLRFKGRAKYGDTRNTLSHQLFNNYAFEPLDKQRLQQPFIDEPTIEKINHTLKSNQKTLNKIRHFLTTQRVVKEVLKIVGVNNLFNKNLSFYLTLKALEKSLNKQK